MKRILAIHGMTCAHCAQRVEDALNALPSASAVVSYAERRAEVQLDDGTDETTLIEAVQAQGYDARNWDDESSLAQSSRVAGEDENRHIAIVGSGSGAFAAAIRAVEAGA
ncbi:cation transporter, partial [Salinisphaera dokdonensis]|uniref:cation transporter n=1 Tax=Salinisphaera dokdonensis TaxID=454598 RepID=UPI003342C370